MNKDETIAMAREAGAKGLRPYSKRLTTEPIVAFRMAPEQLERFAALVAAREREACAQVCESEWATDTEHAFGNELAALIRARGNP